MSSAPAIALIGGLDPSGGAGLLRDCWTVARRAPELERLAVCTALTRQAQGRELRVACTASDRLARALEGVEAHPRLRAVKFGMIPAPALPELIAFVDRLRARSQTPWLVLDPVMDASEGGRLGAPADALLALAQRMDLLTPNLCEEAEFDEGLSRSARLVKGESVPGQPGRVRDRFISGDGCELVLERPRVEGPDPRGTGCALASALTAELARGCSLPTAVAAAVAWLDGARRHLREGPDGRWHLRAVS